MKVAGRFSRSFVAAALAVAACQHGQPAPSGKQASLPSGTVALVGEDRIDLRSVTEIATANGVTPTRARDALVFDALLAAEARLRFGPLAAHRAETSAAARALLQAFTVEARSAGPATDAEVLEGTSARWWELDRPPLRRTTHAVAVVEKPEQEIAARALADRILAAVATATDAASFRRLALPVSAPGVKAKVEDLDPVAEDGRSVNLASPSPSGPQTGRYSAAYVAGVFAIPGVNRASPVVRSEFGFHVIFLSELLPEHRVPLEERRAILQPEILIHRAARLEAEALKHARAVDPVSVERAALDLTEKVNVQQ